MKRVYHPSLNAWQDVPDEAVKEWVQAGWLDKRPTHADDSEAREVGQSYVAPDVAYYEPEPEPPKEGPKAKK